MSLQEDFVHCAVCQLRTTRFIVIKGDRLCNQCLSTSSYESNTSAFKVELLDSDEGESTKMRSITDVKSNDVGPFVKTEPSAAGYEPIGSLPEGAIVHIENELAGESKFTPPDCQTQIANVANQHINSVPTDSSALHLDQPIQFKQERIEDDDEMQTESQQYFDDQSADPVVKEEITFEEPCLTEAHLGPVERKPPVSCPHCDRCFPNRAAVQQHVRRMHQAQPLSRDYCGLEPAIADRLNYHMRTAHESPQLQCPQCPKKFALPNGLKQHLLSHSAPKLDRRPECTICGRKFKSRCRLQQHMERKTVHQERTCPVCGVRVMGYERFEQHLSTHPKPPKTPNRLTDFKISCKYCDHKTTSRTLLRKHNDQNHAEERTVRCRICFVWCNGKVLYERHVQQEHQGNQRQCDVCLQGFVELAELEEHKKNCLGRVLFKCPACQDAYVNREAADKHLATHEASGSSILETRSLQKIFTCALCADDRGYEEQPYKDHVKEAHNGYHILCPDCGAKFRLHRSFVNHRSSQCMFGEKSKEKVFTMYAPVVTQCLHCPRSFKNRWRMEEHIRRIHKAKPAECDICGLKLASTTLVKSHKLSVHTEAKLQCPHCEKKFVNKYYFELHLATHQEGSHLCDECGGKYKTKQILKLHIKRVHSLKKPPSRIKPEPVEQPSPTDSDADLMKCKVCGKEYKGPVGLRKHMKIHDPNRKQYGCDLCDATFLTVIGLRQHRANKDVHHEVTCAVCNTYFRSRERFEEHMAKHAAESVQE